MFSDLLVGIAVVSTLVVMGVAARASARTANAIGLGVLFTVVPLLFAGAEWVVSRPLVTSDMLGTEPFGVAVFAMLVVFVVCVGSVPVRAALVARLPSGGRMLVLALVVLLLSALTAAGGIASLRKPPPEDFLALFDHASLEAGQTARLGSATVTYEKSRCYVEVHEAATRRDYALPEWDHDGGACRPVRVFHTHRDRWESVVITDETGLTYAADSFLFVGANTASEDEAVPSLVVESSPPHIRDFAGRLGAPRAWVVGGVIALVLAGFALVAAVVTRRRGLHAIVTAREAEHTGDGWLRVHGWPPRFVAELKAVPPGTILIHEHHARAPTYRHDGGADAFSISVGTRAIAKTALSMRVSAWAIAAIVAATTLSTPLWVARWHGLL